MSLKLQIISSLFSLTFGFLFSTFLFINKKIIYNKSKFIRLFGSFLIVLLGNLVYFIILNTINNSIFHPYLVLLITVGFVFENYIRTFVKKNK